MKRDYSAPTIELEELSLSTTAASCTNKPIFSPESCEEIGEYSWLRPGGALLNDTSNPVFDKPESCDCYYTWRDAGYFTS